MEEKPLVLCDTNVIIDFYKEDAAILKKLRAIGQRSLKILSHEYVSNPVYLIKCVYSCRMRQHEYLGV